MGLLDQAIYTVTPQGVASAGRPFAGLAGLDQFRNMLAQHISANDPALRALNALGTSPNLALGEGALPSASRGLPAVLNQAVSVPSRAAQSLSEPLALGPGRVATGRVLTPPVNVIPTSGRVFTAGAGEAAASAAGSVADDAALVLGGGLRSGLSNWVGKQAGQGLPGWLAARGAADIAAGGTGKGLLKAATPLKAVGKGGLIAGVAGIPVELGADYLYGKIDKDSEDSNWRRMVGGAAGGATSGAIMGAGAGPVGMAIGATAGAVIGGGLNVAMHELFKDRTTAEEVREATAKQLADTLNVGRQLGMSADTSASIRKQFEDQVLMQELIARSNNDGKNPTPAEMKEIRSAALETIQTNLGEIVAASQAEQQQQEAARQQMAVEQANARIIAEQQQKWLAPLLANFADTDQSAIQATRNEADRIGGDYGKILRAQAAQAAQSRAQMGMVLAAQMQASPWVQAAERAQNYQNQISQQIMAQAIGSILNPPQASTSGGVNQEDLNAILGQ